jgi:replication factor C small subunit
MREVYLWCEKYAPKTISDCILPDSLKSKFQEFVKGGKVPNLILSGGPGVGKTTVAKALCYELDADMMFMNASSERGIDEVRTRMFGFASTTSLNRKRKILILDEADNLTPDAQKALRAAIEELQNNCSFVMTCNYKNKLIPALHSRCSVIDFNIDKKERPKMAAKFFERVCTILDDTSITYDKKVVAKFIERYFPDYRRTLNELQTLSSNGTIDAGSLSIASSVGTKELIPLLKDKNFAEVRKWTLDNLDNDVNIIITSCYHDLYEKLKPESIPEAIAIMAEYQYKAAFVVDQELNLNAMFVQLMALEYK